MKLISATGSSVKNLGYRRFFHVCRKPSYQQYTSKLVWTNESPQTRLFSGSARQSHFSNKRVHLVTPNFLQAEQFLDKVGIVDQHGPHLYGDVLCFAKALSSKISEALACDVVTNCQAIEGERIAFLCPSDVSYTVAQWAVWLCGGIAVPLYQGHPPAQLEYYIQDSACRVLLVEQQYAEKLKPVAEKIGVKLLTMDPEDYMNIQQTDDIESDLDPESAEVPDSDDEGESDTSLAHEDLLWKMQRENKFKYKKAMIVYTSGTTGAPKVSGGINMI